MLFKIYVFWFVFEIRLHFNALFTLTPIAKRTPRAERPVWVSGHFSRPAYRWTWHRKPAMPWPISAYGRTPTADYSPSQQENDNRPICPFSANMHRDALASNMSFASQSMCPLRSRSSKKSKNVRPNPTNYLCKSINSLARTRPPQQITCMRTNASNKLAYDSRKSTRKCVWSEPLFSGVNDMYSYFWLFILVFFFASLLPHWGVRCCCCCGFCVSERGFDIPCIARTCGNTWPKWIITTEQDVHVVRW